MIGSPRIDDEIIYYWSFNSVECFDSTPSAAIIILDEYLESFSSLRSQQEEVGPRRGDHGPLIVHYVASS